MWRLKGRMQLQLPFSNLCPGANQTLIWIFLLPAPELSAGNGKAAKLGPRYSNSTG